MGRTGWRKGARSAHRAGIDTQVSGSDQWYHCCVSTPRSRAPTGGRTLFPGALDACSPSLFAVTDMREARTAELGACAFLNDRDREIAGDVIEALATYEVTAALWSKREQYVEDLIG